MTPVSELAAAWKEEHRLLLEATEELLRHLDRLGPEEAAQLLARRQNSIDRIQNLDGELQPRLEGEEALREELRGVREKVVRRVLELDGVTLGLAQQQMGAIRAEMAGLRMTKKAVRAYEQR